MKHNYSSDFQQLVSSSDKLQDLLINCSFNGKFEGWERRKAFIADAIHKDGTFLDIGCGNGFLLRCLQEWSEFEVVPYGIDINEEFIEKAKELYPNQKNNFATLDVNKDIEDISTYLPSQYDFIFFSSNWSNSRSSNQDVKILEDLLKYVKSDGRLIIGFYGEDKEANLEALGEFKSLGISFDETLENPSGTNLVAWVDKRP